VLTIDDVVDVIQEEAEEDLMRLGGVGDEELSDKTIETVRSRAPWLLVNLLTAFLAASVISLFEATIEEIVALAVLMPIVAGMGGNAGSQTMTVTVRALATRDLDIHNAWRVVRREAGVGLLHGVALRHPDRLRSQRLWFHDVNIGGVIAARHADQHDARRRIAGIHHSAWLLDRFRGRPRGLLPAVFVTAVTDITGFFAFLGLATWWFM
jgi:magnesium transporter